MNGTEGCRGHGEKGGSVKYKNNLLHMGQKLWDDLFKTGCHPPPPSICSTCLLERSEKLETVQEEVTIFSLGDQRHCGLTLKLKIHISMYSEMDTVCVITRHLSQICQLEVTREERVQSNVQLPIDAFSLKDCMRLN